MMLKPDVEKDLDMNQTPHSDESLMLAYANGDIGSFETLYRRHKDALYRYMLRQVSDKDLAHDLYQECWGRIIKAANQYKAEAKWSTWTYRIAHNLVVDHYRDFKPVNTELLDEEAATESRVSAPDHVHEQEVLSAQLKHCMARLPSVQLEVFILTQETDMTLKMIADVVAASHEAVKTRLRYARSALQDCLAKFGLRPANTEQDSGTRP
jgi:RNA polymerase sigma-70 factor (ECF subfamily)